MTSNKKSIRERLYEMYLMCIDAFEFKYVINFFDLEMDRPYKKKNNKQITL